MGRTDSLDRIHAAAWITTLTRRPVTEGVLRYWERKRYLRQQLPGNRRSVQYKLEDLVQLYVLAEMRRQGVSHVPLRVSLRRLSRELPQLLQSNRRRVVLVSTGRVLAEAKNLLMAMLSDPGARTSFAWAFDLGAFVEEAERALEKLT